MKYIKSNAKSDSSVGLFSAKGIEIHYEIFYFVKRPLDVYGPGMFIPFDRLREFIGKASYICIANVQIKHGGETNGKSKWYRRYFLPR